MTEILIWPMNMTEETLQKTEDLVNQLNFTLEYKEYIGLKNLGINPKLH